MNDKQFIREAINRLSPGQALSLAIQARAELARRETPRPAHPTKKVTAKVSDCHPKSCRVAGRNQKGPAT